MIVVHIESGLGNQMLSYCEYLALKKENPDQKIYIETLVYEIPECNDVICQWNGYELERIFGIHASNIRQEFSDEQWYNLREEVKSSQFWVHNWNWPVYFQRAFNDCNLKLNNMRGDFEAKGHTIVALDINRKRTILEFLRKSEMYCYLQRKKNKWCDYRKAKSLSNEQVHFYKSSENELTGQRLTFKFVNSGIERIEKEIRDAFTFPEIIDSPNKNEMATILSCNSVAIHARRGDMLSYNYALYKFGYFKKCINYIRTKVDNPVFFIFCDQESTKWVKNNIGIFGLNVKKDKIRFVDWNHDENSFRDMQLMAACKHQIITRSSFGWWASWLNTNPEKITCSPDAIINTTHHF